MRKVFIVVYIMLFIINMSIITAYGADETVPPEARKAAKVSVTQLRFCLGIAVFCDITVET